MVSITSRLLKRISFFLLLCHPTLAPGESSLRINEFLASNSGGFRDEAGEADDWIELYNLGDEALDPSGYFVTDNLGSPTKWMIPLGTPSIPPGGFLLIWADSSPLQGPLHTTYNLSALGEEIGVFAPDGVTLLDSIVYGPQTTNISVGRFPDGAGSFQVMTTPTPLEANVPGLSDFVAPVVVSPSRGFYTSSQLVVLSTETPEARVVYTLDGSTPTEDDAVYTEPLMINGTTTLRVRAFRDGFLPTPTETHSYIFLSDVVVQSPNQEPPGPGWPPFNNDPIAGQTMDYGMDPNVVNDPRYRDRMVEALTQVPTMSIVTDLENLFDAQTGIYVNAGLKGEEFERPASLELIYPDGREGFQIDAGTRMRGSSSLQNSNPKHAWRFFFRNEYSRPQLEYPLFEEEGVAAFRKVDLRNEQNFSWARGNLVGVTMMRELIWRDVQGAMGHPYTRSRQYHLYVNGHYWGLVMTQERADAWFAASYLGGEREDYDVIKANAEAVHVTGPTDGTIDAWQRFWELTNAGYCDDAAYLRVQGLNPDGTRNPEFEVHLDETNLIDYMLITFYSGSVDGPLGKWSDNTLVNNYYAIRNRNGERGWVHMVHDFETTAMDLFENRLGPYPAGERLQDFSAQWIHQKLMEHPEYRMQFADRAQRHLFNGGVLTQEWLTERFLQRAAEIDAAVIGESARWGDSKQEPPATLDDNWQPALDYFLNTFFPIRGSIVLGQMRSAGLFPTTPAPRFTVAGNPQHGGEIAADGRVGFDGISSGGTVFYTMDGSDPRTRFTQSCVGVSLIDGGNTRRAFVPVGPITASWAEIGFDDSVWASGTGGGVGFETATGFENFIAVDVLSGMFNINASCLVRIPFSISGTVPVGDLELGVRYDDGFVAYLNGVEVARRNAPAGFPAWNAGATAGNDDANAIQFEVINVGESESLLVAGSNVLAIHGLNAGVNSSDFLIDAELAIAGGGAVGGGAPAATSHVYTAPFSLGGSTTVKARTRSESGEWSALLEARFEVESGEMWMLF